jgi:cytochrome c
MLDSFELAKIGGAVCVALLMIFLPKTLIDLNRHKGPVKGGYELPVSAETAAAPAPGGAAPAAAAFDAKAVAAAAATASAEAGKSSFSKCAACHTGTKGGANGVGPNLWGVVGRKKGSVEAFKYSAALTGKGGEWTLEDLAEFVHNPGAFVAGTKMIFPGIKDPAGVSDLLAYLRTLSDGPPK